MPFLQHFGGILSKFAIFFLHRPGCGRCHRAEQNRRCFLPAARPADEWPFQHLRISAAASPPFSAIKHAARLDIGQAVFGQLPQIGHCSSCCQIKLLPQVGTAAAILGTAVDYLCRQAAGAERRLQKGQPFFQRVQQGELQIQASKSKAEWPEIRRQCPRR